MNCPSCHHANSEKSKFCGRCRMRFNHFHLQFSKAKDHIYWILRRASAGFSAGLIAWFFIPIVTRILSQNNSDYFLYMLSGLMGGAFLGCVDGMVEESSPKTVRGALVGGIGGALGGLTFQFFRASSSPDYVLWFIFIFWAIAGAFIGSVSAWWENQSKKLLIGTAAGFFGGGIGAYLGASTHGYLVQELKPQSWVWQRASEALLGGFIGLSLWFAIGAAERLFIFKRRPINHDFKKCDQCTTKNPLSGWYCESCGSVLQEAAPPAKLNLPPYMTLQRISEMFQFLSRLATATGFIAGFVSLFICIPGFIGMEQFVVVIVILIIALMSYSFQVLFRSASELLQIIIKK